MLPSMNSVSLPRRAPVLGELPLRRLAIALHGIERTLRDRERVRILDAQPAVVA